MALTKVTYSMISGNTFSVSDFGAIGDGVTDDAGAIQAAIDAATVVGGDVEFDGSKTYISGPILPKSNVRLQLNGATIKLKDGVNNVFFDGRYGGADFGIYNGIIDGNKANNAGIYNLSGMSVYTGWNGLEFINVQINNVFRTSLKFDGGTQNINIENMQSNDCGLAGYAGMFGYALSMDPGTSTKKLSIKNFLVNNMYGYGIHFYGCEDFVAENITLQNITHSGGSGIGITLTQAKRGRISDVYTFCDGNAIECNASTDVLIENVNVDNTNNLTRYGLIFGDNGTGIFNERVTVKNYKIKNTNFTYAAALNGIKYCTFDGLDFDSGISTTISGSFANDRNNRIVNSKFNVNISVAFSFYQKFTMQSVSFSNFYVNQFDYQTAQVSSPITNGTGSVAIASGGGVGYIDLSAFNEMGQAGFVTGKLRVTSLVSASQGSYQECLFLASNNNTTFNLSAIDKVANATDRSVTITADAANRRFVLTNSTGVTLGVFWTLDLHKASF